MSKVVRLTECDLVKLVKKIISEQKDLKKEISIPEILNKTVTFDVECRGVSLGKVQMKIIDAKHITNTSINGTEKTLELTLTKLDGKKGNKFKTLTFIPKTNVFSLLNRDLGNLGGTEESAIPCSGVGNISSINLTNFIKSLKKYPLGFFPNEKIKTNSDFQP